MGLVGLGVGEHHAGGLLGAAGPPAAVQHHGVGGEGAAADHFLHQMGAGQGEQVVVVSRQVQAHGHQPLQPQGFPPAIYHLHMAANGVQIPEDGVKQLDLRPGVGIGQTHHQGLGLLGLLHIGGGQARKGRFARQNLISLV